MIVGNNPGSGQTERLIGREALFRHSYLEVRGGNASADSALISQFLSWGKWRLSRISA